MQAPDSGVVLWAAQSRPSCLGEEQVTGVSEQVACGGSKNQTDVCTRVFTRLGHANRCA